MPTIPTVRLRSVALLSGYAVLRPFAGAHIALGLGKFAHGAQQQTERGVGDLLGQHVGRVGDGDAVRAGPGGVDVVVADAEGRDDLEPGKTRRMKRTVDPLLGGGDRHAAHARRGLGKNVSRSLASENLIRLKAPESPLTITGLGGPISRTSVFSAAIASLASSHQHRDGLLRRRIRLERRQAAAAPSAPSTTR